VVEGAPVRIKKLSLELTRFLLDFFPFIIIILVYVLYLFLTQLAEAKKFFDRFAVADLISASDAAQAFTEMGVVLSHSEVVRVLEHSNGLLLQQSCEAFVYIFWCLLWIQIMLYFRENGYFGSNRDIDFFDFLKTLSVIRSRDGSALPLPHPRSPGAIKSASRFISDSLEGTYSRADRSEIIGGAGVSAERLERSMGRARSPIRGRPSPSRSLHSSGSRRRRSVERKKRNRRRSRTHRGSDSASESFLDSGSAASDFSSDPSHYSGADSEDTGDIIIDDEVRGRLYRAFDDAADGDINMTSG
jgi:hypothetical protein